MKRIRDKISDRIGEALPKDRVAIFFLAFTALVIAASVWGPEALTGYKDKEILNALEGNRGGRGRIPVFVERQREVIYSFPMP